MISTKIEWAAWAIITGFLLWVLTAAIKAGMLIFSGALAWPFALLIVPALALDIWLLDGSLTVAMRSWR